MKKLILIALALMLAVPMMAQRVPSDKKACLSAGILQGGGGLVGVDFEYLIGQHFSAQAGVGYISYGVSLSYHFKPFLNSSMISMNYFHQGIGPSYTASWVGPTYTYRAPKLFQCSIGMGYIVDFGPQAVDSQKNNPLGFLYSVGLYFPI